MSSDEEQQVEEVSPSRKRARTSRGTDDSSGPSPSKKPDDSELDGIHYACSVCDQVFLHKANYLRHTQRHEPPGGFLCSICVQPFTTDWDRNKHKRDEHSVFRCRLCNEEFPVEDDYNEHIQEQHAGRDREYDICPTCGQQFRTASQLKVHIESNCGTDKKHECEECHQRYLTLASLNAHMIKHAGIKSHLCNFCGASFLNKGQLKVHVRMHTGERPYKCNQCDKAFAHRESLITHSTTHSGIKPYYCSYCQSRFSCIGNLLKHRRARADTCGLPQYCQTNKIAARPNIKTMPNLTDRPVYTQKVVQRSSPVKSRSKPKPSEIVVSVEVVPPKKRPSKQVARPALPPPPPSTVQSDDEDDRTKDFEDEYYERKPNVAKLKVAPAAAGSKYRRLVDLKVEPGDSDEAGECSVVKVEKHAASSGDDEHVEFFEVKIEQENDELIETIEEETLEEYEEVLSEKVVTLDSKGRAVVDSDDDFNDATNEDYLEEATDEFQPPKQQDQYHDGDVVIKRKFTTKPPVVTQPKRRGRPKRPPAPKFQNVNPEHVIVINLEEKQKVIDEQRAIYDANIIEVTVGCLQCGICPAQYCSPFLAARHLERDHGIMMHELGETLRYDRVFTRERKYQCRFCNRLYVNEKALEKHILLHGPNGTAVHKCPICTSWFESEEEALNHSRIEHREKLECPVCFKFFSNQERMIKHRKQIHEHTRVKQDHVCPKCGKNFSSRGAVSDHERSNCGQNPIYPCEICGKRYNTASSLKNHYSLHSDELPFSCQYCGKCYRTRGQVKVHERTHTGEKPYACDFCPKRFGHRETLHTHRSLHTGIKRYMCSGCGMRFTCISNLQAHRRSHKTTCGMIPTYSKVRGPDGVHELPEGYELPYPLNDQET
uniref:Zinc finger protein 557 n=1 Tax=Culex pipiens TaxID=7175 RepID=A0A8D8FTS5_CULPI